MPLFDYKCECGEITEFLVKKEVSDVLPCKACGKPAKKIVGRPSVQFNFVPTSKLYREAYRQREEEKWDEQE